MTTRKTKQRRSGFTLVELIVVIAIVAGLMALLLPVVLNAVTSTQQSTYKLEADMLAEAVEKYRNKYGDYPPDGSSWQVMERHLRKAFPQILQSEMNLLNPTVASVITSNQIGQYANVRNDFDTSITQGNTDSKVMDPAEALVFFLGGFSSDPQRPFTGNGGPFLNDTSITAPTSSNQKYQYNASRANALYEFNLARLTLTQVPAGGSVVYNVSNDEFNFYSGAVPTDLLPVYLGRSGDITSSAPFVYFDSRTYVQSKSFGPYINYFQRETIATATTTGSEFGAIRPLMSDAKRTPSITGTSNTDIKWLRVNLFMEDTKFQIIGPGLDGKYGGRLAADVDTSSMADFCSLLVKCPSGASYQPAGVPGAAARALFDTWKLPAANSYYKLSRGFDDNAGNFTAKTFGVTRSDNL